MKFLSQTRFQNKPLPKSRIRWQVDRYLNVLNVASHVHIEGGAV